MNKSNKMEFCERCNTITKRDKKEVYRDEDKNDSFHVIYYFLYYCKNCGPDKKKLAELDYWKKLSEELDVPDLKYWKLGHNRGTECFYVSVKSIECDQDDIWGESSLIWQEIISKEELAKTILDDNKFRDLITDRLRKIAKEIKKERSKPKKPSWKEKFNLDAVE